MAPREVGQLSGGDGGGWFRDPDDIRGDWARLGQGRRSRSPKLLEQTADGGGGGVRGGKSLRAR